MSNIDFDSIRTKISILLDSYSNQIQPGNAKYIAESLEAAEYGVAFEALCYYLEMSGARLCAHDAQAIEKVATQMGIDSRWWKNLLSKQLSSP